MWWKWHLGVAVLVALVSFDALSRGAETPTPPTSASSDPVAAVPGRDADEIEQRFRRLETLISDQSRQIQKITEENRRLLNQMRSHSPVETESDSGNQAKSPAPPPSPTLPAPEEVPPPVSPSVRLAAGVGTEFSERFHRFVEQSDFPDGLYLTSQDNAYLTGSYEKGFILVEPTDKQKNPFALKLNLTTQMRYTGFSRSVATWTDNAGQVLPISNRSYFSLNRNFLTFSGYAFSPQLQYNLLLFSTSTSNVNVLAGSLSYEIDKSLAFHLGYFLVPSTREWITPFAYTLGADRTMANTFFRAAFSPGVWANGEFSNGFHYIAGIFNDFNAPSNSAGRINNNMTYSGNIWWDPLGPFGAGYSDEEYHEQLAIRTGTSLTYQRVRREPNQQGGIPNPENTLLRLSDGTPIFQPGALGSGATLQGANVGLFSYDLAFKYRGFSLSGEYYGRWINGLDTGGQAIPGSNLNVFDSGGLLQFSYAILPKRLELFARTSAIFGKFGDGSEYGGGVNWYPFENRNVRGTFEVKRINHSPADNLLYGYFAGESGMLYQAQFVTSF